MYEGGVDAPGRKSELECLERGSTEGLCRLARVEARINRRGDDSCCLCERMHAQIADDAPAGLCVSYRRHGVK